MATIPKRSTRAAGVAWMAVAGLALAAGLLLYHRPGGRLLPALRHYENLPAAFAHRLRETRDRAARSDTGPEDVRKLAHLYQANRLDDETRECYHLIELMPGGLTAGDHDCLAEVALRAGNLAEAEKELQAVVAADPKYLPARLSLAEVLFKTGHDDQAEKQYLAVVELEPAQSQALFGLARIALQRGDDDGAVARLEDLMASHPESTSGAALFAQVLERRGESDRAVAMTEWSRQKPEPIPADPWLDELLTDCYDQQRLALQFEDYAKTGQMDRAVPFLQRVEELEPASPVPSLLRGWSDAQAHRDAEAVKEYRAALAKGGDPEKICPYLVQSLLTLGQTDEAAKLMAGYYARMPESIPILTSYADVAVRQNNVNLSLTLLTKVLQKEPYLYAANVSLGKILWASGQRDEAAKCLQRVATVYAGDVASRALLGEYYLGKSNPVAALKPLEQALPLVSPDTPIHRSLAAMLDSACFQAGTAEMGRAHFSEAGAFFDRGIRISPANPNAYAGKANALVQLRQFRAAADTLEKLAKLQPDNPTIYLSLGDVVYQDGARDEARRDWLKALQLAPAADSGLQSALDQRLNGRINAETFK